MNTNQTLKCQWVDLAEKVLKMKSILDHPLETKHLTEKQLKNWGIDVKLTHKELTELANNTLNIVLSKNKRKHNTTPLCPTCKKSMIQSNEGTKSPICENPTCPTNDYTHA